VGERVKPEPLVDKIKEWWNQARVMLDPKNEEAFRDEVNNLILIIKRWEKQRAEWLLKEIDEEKEEKDKKWYKFFNSSDECEGYLKALENVKQKIKKAFSGVIEE